MDKTNQHQWGIWSEEEQIWLIVHPGIVFATNCKGYAEAQSKMTDWRSDQVVREFNEWWWKQVVQQKERDDIDAVFEQLQTALRGTKNYCRQAGLNAAGDAFEKALKYLDSSDFSTDKRSTEQ